MKPVFEYKGYFGSAEVNLTDNILHGKLMFIKDVVTYVADSPRALKIAFEEAVDDYLQTCIELGDEPDVPFKGTFNVRIGPDRPLVCREERDSGDGCITSPRPFPEQCVPSPGGARG